MATAEQYTHSLHGAHLEERLHGWRIDAIGRHYQGPAKGTSTLQLSRTSSKGDKMYIVVAGHDYKRGQILPSLPAYESPEKYGAQPNSLIIL